MSIEQFTTLAATFFHAIPIDELRTLYDLTCESSNVLTPSSQVPQVPASAAEPGLPYLAFVEIITLVSLTLSPSPTALPTTLLGLTAALHQTAYDHVVSLHAHPPSTRGSPTYPLLTRYLTLLSTSNILTSKLGYHESARVFIDQCGTMNVDVQYGKPGDFERVFEKCIPILDALRCSTGDTCTSLISSTYYTLNSLPHHLNLPNPLHSPHMLQYLGSGPLSPLRYVFLRYGDYIPDDLMECSSEGVAGTWNKACEGTSGNDMAMPVDTFLDFARHFNLLTITDAYAILHHHIPPGSMQLTFPQFLDTLTSLAMMYFPFVVPPNVSRNDPSLQLLVDTEPFRNLLQLMDPESLMFAPPAKQPVLPPPPTPEINPFATPFDPPSVTTTTLPPSPPTNGTSNAAAPSLPALLHTFLATHPTTPALTTLYNHLSTLSPGGRPTRRTITAYLHATLHLVENTMTPKHLNDIYKLSTALQRAIEASGEYGDGSELGAELGKKGRDNSERSTRAFATARANPNSKQSTTTVGYALPSFIFLYTTLTLHLHQIPYPPSPTHLTSYLTSLTTRPLVNTVARALNMALFAPPPSPPCDLTPPPSTMSIYLPQHVDPLHSLLTTHSPTLLASFHHLLSPTVDFGAATVQGCGVKVGVGECVGVMERCGVSADPFVVAECVAWVLGSATPVPDWDTSLVGVFSYGLLWLRVCWEQGGRNVKGAVNALGDALEKLKEVVGEGEREVDEFGGCSAVWGGGVEVKLIYEETPVWDVSTWVKMLRTWGVLERVSFGEAVRVWEEAGQITDKRVGGAWVARVGKAVSFEVFWTAMKEIAVVWGQTQGTTSITGVNTCLNRLLVRRIFPVMQRSALVNSFVKPTEYDPNSLWLLREFESALVALFGRYASGTAGGKEVVFEVDEWDNPNDVDRSDAANQAGVRGALWNEDIETMEKGMTQTDWVAFAKDFNLTPGVVSLSGLKQIFEESGSQWPVFNLMDEEGEFSPVVSMGVPNSPLPFASFCEALLRCGCALNLDGVESDAESNASAHLDVLFHSMDAEGLLFFKSKARLKEMSAVKRAVGVFQGVEEFESLLKLVGGRLDEKVEAEVGAPRGAVVFSVEQCCEAAVRLGLGSLGLLTVLDAWEVAASGRSFLLIGEVALVLKKLVGEKQNEGGFVKYLDSVLFEALEKKVTDDVEYLGLVTPVCGRALDCSIVWKAGEILERLWRLELVRDNGQAQVRDVATHLIDGVAATGLVEVVNVHETCAMAVATLAGSSTVTLAGGVLCMTRLQFDWCVCRVVALAVEVGGGGGGVEEMFEVVLELIKLDITMGGEEEVGGGEKEEEKTELEEAGVEPPPMSDETLFKVKTIFEVYSVGSEVLAAEGVVEEKSFIQFLVDVQLLRGSDSAGGDKVGRVEAMELFRVNVSAKSTMLCPSSSVGLCFEDFYCALHCIALIVTEGVEDEEALPALLERALAGL